MAFAVPAAQEPFSVRQLSDKVRGDENPITRVAQLRAHSYFIIVSATVLQCRDFALPPLRRDFNLGCTIFYLNRSEQLVDTILE